MKRSISQLSSIMTPGANNEGFNASPVNRSNEIEVENVVIAGAGPAGLMLA